MFRRRVRGRDGKRHTLARTHVHTHTHTHVSTNTHRSIDICLVVPPLTYTSTQQNAHAHTHPLLYSDSGRANTLRQTISTHSTRPRGVNAGPRRKCQYWPPPTGCLPSVGGGGGGWGRRRKRKRKRRRKRGRRRRRRGRGMRREEGVEQSEEVREE